MNIQKVPVSRILPHPKNPRITLTPKDPEYQQIKKSLKVHGYIQLLIWNSRSGYLISGNQRFSIMVAEGMKEIEVVVVDLDPRQEENLMIAMNKISGRWDNEKLSAMLDEFSKIPDFDCELIGFTMPELSQLLDAYHDVKDDGFNLEAEVESIKEPITKRGDVITLKSHRLMCGDATSAEDLHTLIGEEKVDLLDMDWPYNVDYMGGNCPRVDTRPKKSRKWDRIYSDNLPQDEYEAFMRKVLINIKPYLKSGAVFYQWQAHRQLGPLYQILNELDFYVSSLICWEKNFASISYADYSFQTEQAVYGWLKGQGHYFAGKPGESNLWQVKRDPTKSYEHPCQKPRELADRAIKNSSKRDEVVLDVFIGSGNIMLSAEALGRRCFGMELDEKFCDVVIRRFIKFVGRENVAQEIVDKYLKESRDAK